MLFELDNIKILFIVYIISDLFMQGFIFFIIIYINFLKNIIISRNKFIYLNKINKIK